ncbi:hypothetical protein ACJ72_04453 [Emergomyces africanus]|uniref:Uncharacterized protein n=1 Tax=Emergomyces africanus TaxID=1955775 RepID=A0A1B7NWS8_9EURO|nr:hypothetical protein ACJ72_04453 [Emergomyces africanus]
MLLGSYRREPRKAQAQAQCHQLSAAPNVKLQTLDELRNTFRHEPEVNLLSVFRRIILVVFPLSEKVNALLARCLGESLDDKPSDAVRNFKSNVLYNSLLDTLRKSLNLDPIPGPRQSRDFIEKRGQKGYYFSDSQDVLLADQGAQVDAKRISEQPSAWPDVYKVYAFPRAIMPPVRILPAGSQREEALQADNTPPNKPY